MGVIRFVIFESSPEEQKRLRVLRGILVLVNLLWFLMMWVLSGGITDWEGVLTGVYFVTIMNFQETTWFLLNTLGGNEASETV